MKSAERVEPAPLLGKASQRAPRFCSWLVTPHELFYGGFLLTALVCLVLHAGPLDPDSLVYVVALTVFATLALNARLRPTKKNWRSALMFFPLSILILFPLMKRAFPKVDPEKYDYLLQYFDSFLVNQNPSLWCESFARPWITDLLSISYQLFFGYLFVATISYLRMEIEIAERFIAGLFTIYGIGFLGYLFVPAVGPWLDMASQFHGPLAGSVITALNSKVVLIGTNLVDVFPSLHCAVTAYILFFDRRFNYRRFQFMVLPCAGLWFATIYLRYHYLTDVLCGFVLTGAGLAMAFQFSTFSVRLTKQHK
jgi:membrane-associated phospholipid phosphatase